MRSKHPFGLSWFFLIVCKLFSTFRFERIQHISFFRSGASRFGDYTLRWDNFFYGAVYRTILPRRKGSSILRKSIVAPELVAMTRRILDHIDFHGVCGVDFRIGRDGRAYFLECNPRFSGGLATQIQSGFDQPFLWWKLATGQSLDSESIRFRAGKYNVDSPLLSRRSR